MSRMGTFIGEVARQCGLSIHAIRFYEAEGLLPEASRTEAGYRVYTTENIEQLKFIKKAQQLGFSLSQVRELLVLRDRNTDACSHVRSLLREKLGSVRDKLRELKTLETDLERALGVCERQVTRKHPGNAARCPLLVKLGHKVGRIER